MQIKWEVSDGYCGKHRPQYCNIDDEEILNCDSVDEAMQLIEDSILDAFHQEISAEWDEPEIRMEVEDLLKVKKELE